MTTKIRRTVTAPCKIKRSGILPLERSSATLPAAPVITDMEKEPAPVLMAGISLAAASLTALLMFPVTATVSLAVAPLLLGAGLMRRGM